MLKRLLGTSSWVGLLFGALMISISAHAEESGLWRAESDHYRAYLGVVPASLIRREPVLVDGDRTLHGGADRQSGAAQHVMVAIYRKPDNARVVGATVIAKVRKSKLLAGSAQERPLERMATTGGITYGNYFDMPDSATYRIDVTVYESDGNGGEDLSFTYDRR